MCEGSSYQKSHMSRLKCISRDLKAHYSDTLFDHASDEQRTEKLSQMNRLHSEMVLPIIFRPYYPLIAAMNSLKVKPLVLLNLTLRLHAFVTDEMHMTLRNMTPITDQKTLRELLASNFTSLPIFDEAVVFDILLGFKYRSMHSNKSHLHEHAELSIAVGITTRGIMYIHHTYGHNEQRQGAANERHLYVARDVISAAISTALDRMRKKCVRASISNDKTVLAIVEDAQQHNLCAVLHATDEISKTVLQDMKSDKGESCLANPKHIYFDFLLIRAIPENSPSEKQKAELKIDMTENSPAFESKDTIEIDKCVVEKDTKGLKKVSEIFLLMGQSNMSGRGELSYPGSPSSRLSFESSGSEIVSRNRIQVYDPVDGWTNKFEKELHMNTDILKKDRVGLGPGTSFAVKFLELKDQQSEKKYGISLSNSSKNNTAQSNVGLIPCAVGGSSLKEWTAHYLQHRPALIESPNLYASANFVPLCDKEGFFIPPASAYHPGCPNLLSCAMRCLYLALLKTQLVDPVVTNAHPIPTPTNFSPDFSPASSPAKSHRTPSSSPHAQNQRSPASPHAQKRSPAAYHPHVPSPTKLHRNSRGSSHSPVHYSNTVYSPVPLTRSLPTIGVLWCQGETDAMDQTVDYIDENPQKYDVRLSLFLTRLRLLISAVMRAVRKAKELEADESSRQHAMITAVLNADVTDYIPGMTNSRCPGMKSSQSHKAGGNSQNGTITRTRSFRPIVPTLIPIVSVAITSTHPSLVHLKSIRNQQLEAKEYFPLGCKNMQEETLPYPSSSASILYPTAKLRRIADFDVVDAFGLELKSDSLHYTATAAIALGNMMASSMFGLMNGAALNLDSKKESIISMAQSFRLRDSDWDDELTRMVKIYEKALTVTAQKVAEGDSMTGAGMSGSEKRMGHFKTSGLKSVNFTNGEIFFPDFCRVLQIVLNSRARGGARYSSSSSNCHSSNEAMLEEDCAPLPSQNSLKFVDLGCGSGSCLAAALLLSSIHSQRPSLFSSFEREGQSKAKAIPLFSTVLGLDLMRSKVRECETLMEVLLGWDAALREDTAVQVVENDFLQAFRPSEPEATSWHDADVVYACATCFADDVLQPLVALFQHLKIGAHVILMDRPVLSGSKQTSPNKSNKKPLITESVRSGYGCADGDDLSEMFGLVGSCQVNCSWGTGCAYVYLKLKEISKSRSLSSKSSSTSYYVRP